MLSLSQPLILASQSPYRAAVLRSAGFEFSQIAAEIDESGLKDTLAQETFETIAIQLAIAKGLYISRQFPTSVIIAADQLCVMRNQIFSKPGNKERAIQQLTELSGNKHSLVNGMVLCKDGRCLWSDSQQCHLDMRHLTSGEILRYIDLDTPYDTCGAYKIESFGSHLFSSIQGSSDAIQGLPLLPLLQAMREHQFYSL